MLGAVMHRRQEGVVIFGFIGVDTEPMGFE